MRIAGECRNHAPIGDVARRVEHVEQNERDNEQRDEPGGVHVDESKQAGEHHHEQHGGHNASDELPDAETAPLGARVVDDIAQDRVEEDLRDADGNDQSGDQGYHARGHGLVGAREQRRGHVGHEERAHGVVERRLTKIAEGEGRALAD